MTAYLLTAIPSRELDTGGNPVSGAKLHTWIAGTTTPLATYTDDTGGTPLPNPIVADVGGHYPQIWIGSSAYDLEARKADDATVLWQRLNVSAPQVVADKLRADLAAAGGGDLVDGSQAGPAVATRTLGARSRDWWHIKDFLETGDGAYWHQAMQRAADSGEVVFFDPVSYDVAEEVAPLSGARLRGAGNWGGAASTNGAKGVTTLNYVGAGGLNSCVIRLSDAAVGVEPADTSNRDLQNVTFTGFTIAGGIAERGLYGVRCMGEGNCLDFITVTGTTKAGFWLAECFAGSARNWVARTTSGKGFSVGVNDFSWANATVDQCTLDTFLAFSTGCDSSGNPLNAFDDVDGSLECGFDIRAGRNMNYHNLQASNCSGPGLYWQPLLNPQAVRGLYIEGCGRSASSSQQWAIWYNGDASAVPPYLKMENGRLGLSPAIKIKGTVPSITRRAGRLVFSRFPQLGDIDAAWNNYDLDDCDPLVSFIGAGVRPSNVDRMRSTDSSMGISGSIRWTTAAGAIANVRKNGTLAAGVARTSAGLFVVSSREVYANGFQAIPGTVPSGWTLEEVSRTTSSITLTTKLAGVATDPTWPVQLMLMGDYD